MQCVAVCCCVMPCVAVWCRVLQCGTVFCSVLIISHAASRCVAVRCRGCCSGIPCVLQRIPVGCCVCGSMLQWGAVYVAAYCSGVSCVLQRIAVGCRVCCSLMQLGAMFAVCCRVLPCVAMCCCVLPSVAMCCNVLPCVVVCRYSPSSLSNLLLPPAEIILNVCNARVYIHT